MAAERCTITEHGPPHNPYSKRCEAEAVYRIVDEEKEGFACKAHARILRDMFEPGTLKKLRTR